jgi:hypothetical protein
MGIRGEIFTTRVQAHNRSYFFNVKENRRGDIYLNLVESKCAEDSGFERQSLVLFPEDTSEFLKAFDEALRIFEKTARERRKGGGADARARAEKGGEKRPKRKVRVRAIPAPEKTEE